MCQQERIPAQEWALSPLSGFRSLMWSRGARVMGSGPLPTTGLSAPLYLFRTQTGACFLFQLNVTPYSIPPSLSVREHTSPAVMPHVRHCGNTQRDGPGCLLSLHWLPYVGTQFKALLDKSNWSLLWGKSHVIFFFLIKIPAPKIIPLKER